MAAAVLVNLDSFPIPQRLAEVIQSFTGRSWILPRLADWLEKDHPRHFLITGGPGTGKSMLTAWLAGHGPLPAAAEASQQLEKLRASVKGVHYCRFNTGQVTAAALASNLAKQLGNRIPDFNQILLESLSEYIVYAPRQEVGRAENSPVIGNYIERLDLGELETQETFSRALGRPLKKLYQGNYKEKILLLVDALDEAYGASGLVQLLAGLTDLPVQVRLLITTRGDPRLLKEYAHADRLDLVQDCPPGEADIRDYTAAYLTGKAKAEPLPLPAEKITALAERISDASQGQFLYAYHVAADLVERLKKGPLPETIEFPAGLAGHYQEFLNRELGKDEDRWYAQYRPVLGLLAVAQGDGFSPEQLERFTQNDVKQVIRNCAQYIQTSPQAGQLRLFHKSFAEFLLSDADNQHYHIDAYRMHRLVVDDLYQDSNGYPDYTTWDGYGQRYAHLHLAGAAEAPNLNERLRQVSRLAALTADPAFRQIYLAETHDPSLLVSALRLALTIASRTDTPRALPQLLTAAGELSRYRRSRQMPELVLSEAEAGGYDQALRNLSLFNLETYWRQAAELVIAWQAARNKLPAADAIVRRIQKEGAYNPTIGVLFERVDSTIREEQPGLPLLNVQYQPDEYVLEKILARLSGAGGEYGFIQEYVREGIGFNPEFVEGVESGGARFLADEDAPLLAAFAIQNPQASEDYLRRYLDLHLENKYIVYRDNSLWRILAALLHHPNQEFTLGWLTEVLRVVLERGGLQFEGSLQAARLALNARLGQAEPSVRLDRMRRKAARRAESLEWILRQPGLIGQPDLIAPTRSLRRLLLKDRWGEHKRCLSALAEAFSRLPGNEQKLYPLLAAAFKLPRGFAGFMAPAWLNLAEAIRVCGLEAHLPVQEALHQALISAQKIQEEVFSARTTAVVKGMMKWWENPAAEPLPQVVERFADNPRLPEFCAVHILGETFPLRSQLDPDILLDQYGNPDPGLHQMIPLSWHLLNAASLRDLAEAFRLPLDDFLASNPEMDLDQPYPGMDVNVPDPRMVPLMAAFLSAEVLSSSSLPDKEKRRLIQLLVPPATGDPTALATVQARLLLACEAIPKELADSIAAVR
jgi:hypothetical protein